MSRIHWRDGEHRDRQALNQFLCTPPPVRPRWGRAAPPRERDWEFVAQGAVRALQPPAGPNEIILIGEDDDGIAAVAHAQVDGDWSNVFVPVLAVALRCRSIGRPPGAGKVADGPTVGDQLLDELINRAASRADAIGFPDMRLWAKIHPHNRACQAMSDRGGAITTERDGDLDIWALRISFH